MALTKDERRALEWARELIASGRQEHICFARDDADGVDHAAAYRIKAYIRYQLGGGGRGLDDWQHGNGIDRETDEQVRADRLAWIDWMLGKPLPGEQVVLTWDEKIGGTSEAEYCGRFFSIMPREDGYSVIEIEDPEKALGRRICRIAVGIERGQIDAAIVAHVWPEA